MLLIFINKAFTVKRIIIDVHLTHFLIALTYLIKPLISLLLLTSSEISIVAVSVLALV